MFCSIDTYKREYGSEKEAWKQLGNDVFDSKDVIIESCGEDWRFELLARYLKDVFTVEFIAREKILLKRCKKRQEKFSLVNQDELNSITYLMSREPEYPMTPDFSIDTSILSKDEVYKVVTSEVLRYRCQKGQKEKENGKD